MQNAAAKKLFASFFGLALALLLLFLFDFSLGFIPERNFKLGNARHVPGPKLSSYPHEIPNSLEEILRPVSKYPPLNFELKPDPKEFHYFRTEHDMGVAAPNFQGTIRGVIPDGRVIYSHRLTTDSRGQRIWPEGPKLEPRREHLVFMGCSYTFGAGVGDEETFVSRVNLHTKHTAAYNRGFMGQGPVEVLKKIRTMDLLGGVCQKKGTGAYVFMYDHLNRALGRMSVIARWGGHTTVAEEDAPGKFRTLRQFQDSRPFWTQLMQVLYKTNTVHFFDLDFPLLRQSHFQWFARLIKNIKTEYLAHFGAENRFVFIFFPEPPYYTEPLKAALEEQEIEYLDYSNPRAPDAVVGEAGYIDYDGHPTAKVHEAFARLLVKDLKLQ